MLSERLEAATAVVDQLVWFRNCWTSKQKHRWQDYFLFKVKAMGPAGPGQAVIKEWLPYSRYAKV